MELLYPFTLNFEFHDPVFGIEMNGFWAYSFIYLRKEHLWFRSISAAELISWKRINRILFMKKHENKNFLYKNKNTII